MGSHFYAGAPQNLPGVVTASEAMGAASRIHSETGLKSTPAGIGT